MSTADRGLAVALASAVPVKVAIDSGAPGALWVLPWAAVLAAAFFVARSHSQTSRYADGWRVGLIGLGLWYLSGVGPHVGGDGVEYYVAARSLLFDGDVDVRNDFACVGHPAVITIDGEVKARFPVGLSLLFLPPLALAHLGTGLAWLLGSGIPANGCSTPYISAVVSTSFAYGFAGLLVLDALLRRFYSRGIAFLTTVAVWLATPLYFYMLRAPSMSHAAASAIFTVMIALCARAAFAESDPAPRLWLGVGIGAGLLALVRPNDLVHLAIPLAVILFRVRDRGAALRRVWIGPTVAMAIQGVWWFAVFGGELLSKVRRIGRVAAGDPQIAEVLFSARHGLFTWTPLYLLAPLGWLLWWRRDRLWSLLCMFGFVLLMVQTSTTGDWWGADSFGQRRMLTLTALFALGIAESLYRLAQRPWIPLAAGLLMLAVWNQQFGYLFDAQWLGPRDRPIALAALVRGQIELAQRGLIRAARWMPRPVWVLAHDNLSGVWIGEGASPLAGRIELGRDYDAFPQLFTEGWYEPDHDEAGPYRYSLGRRAVLTLPIRAPADRRATLRLRPVWSPIRVALWANDIEIASWAPPPGWSTHELAWPATAQRPGLNRLEMRFEAEDAPETLARSAEAGERVRKRAWIAVRWMTIEPSPMRTSLPAESSKAVGPPAR